jgi:dimeric dUTPase (all-alpha-NTP-PPase superfamily)
MLGCKLFGDYSVRGLLKETTYNPSLKKVNAMQIAQMLTLQQQLNDQTNGIGWEKGVTKQGKIINWRRCAYMESLELIDSYPWKHWKNITAKANSQNILIECVDIWHFILSEALMEYKIHHKGSIDALASIITNLPNYPLFTQSITPTTASYEEQIKNIEGFIQHLFSNASIEKIIDSFFKVAMQSNLNLSTLYQLYIGKNILNQFRQDHGYKEGSYIKIWKGGEDNEVMQTLLKEDITPKQLYQKLQTHYPQKG